MQDKPNSVRRTRTSKPGIYYRIGRDGKRRYEITWLEHDSGRRRWKTVAGNQDAAEAELHDIYSRVNRGERIGPSRVRFGEYAEVWLAEQRGRLRPTTFASYETNLRRHILPRFGRRRLSEIGEDDVLLLISELRQGIVYVERGGHLARTERCRGYAPWTIRGVLSPLSRILGQGARKGMLAANPVALLERGARPSVPDKEKRILSSDEITALVAAAPAAYRALIATGAMTGLRLSELLGLVWADVDLAAGFVHVRKQLGLDKTRVEPKTRNAVRDVVLVHDLVRLLKSHKERAFRLGHARANDFVFASSAGTPLERRNVSRRGLEPAISAAGLGDDGLPRLSMHSLRDTYASHLILDLRLDVVQVSRLLGHSKPSVTANTYARLFDKARHSDEVRKALEASPFGNALETIGGEPRPDPDRVQMLNMASIHELDQPRRLPAPR